VSSASLEYRSGPTIWSDAGRHCAQPGGVIRFRKLGKSDQVFAIIAEWQRYPGALKDTGIDLSDPLATEAHFDITPDDVWEKLDELKAFFRPGASGKGPPSAEPSLRSATTLSQPSDNEAEDGQALQPKIPLTGTRNAACGRDYAPASSGICPGALSSR